MLRSRKISSLGLRLDTTSQISGYSISSDTAMSPACFRIDQSVARAGRRRRPTALPVVMSSVARAGAVSVVIEHPELREPEIEGRERRDHDEQEPRHGAGRAHVVVDPARAVEEERVEHR